MAVFDESKFDRSFRQLGRHPNFINAAFRRARRDFIQSRNQLLQEFDEHPVTIELESGSEDPINTPNFSNTLSGVGGSGKGSGSPNLFSFLGFPFGSNPVKPLRKLLSRINIIKTSNSARYNRKFITYRFPITAPSESEIDDAAPMPFGSSGRSWVDAIEKGAVSGINSYLYGVSPPQSRSKGGIQAKVRGSDRLQRLRSGARFRRTSYLTSMLRRFSSQFSVG